MSDVTPSDVDRIVKALEEIDKSLAYVGQPSEVYDRIVGRLDDIESALLRGTGSVAFAEDLIRVLRQIETTLAEVNVTLSLMGEVREG